MHENSPDPISAFINVFPVPKSRAGECGLGRRKRQIVSCSHTAVNQGLQTAVSCSVVLTSIVLSLDDPAEHAEQEGRQRRVKHTDAKVSNVSYTPAVHTATFQSTESFFFLEDVPTEAGIPQYKQILTTASPRGTRIP